MRRRILLTALLVLLAGMASAIVYENGSTPDCPPGQACILDSGSSASASAGVNENGTEYRAELSMLNRSQADTGNSLSNINYSEGDVYRVEFSGTITAPTPCHALEHSVEEGEGDTYTLNVDTVVNHLDNQSMCAQVMTGIEYSAGFETDKPFSLEVQHDGETVDTLTHPGYQNNTEEPVDQEDSVGVFEGFFSWFSQLF